MEFRSRKGTVVWIPTSNPIGVLIWLHAQLAPGLSADGVVTAANASWINDAGRRGVMSKEKADALGLAPLQDAPYLR